MQRFGVEGCEAVLVGLESLVARCAQHGVRRIELGMPHRGRLNVLCNILKKPPGALYGEMEGGQSEFHVGDVKYHMGQSASLEFVADVSTACDLKPALLFHESQNACIRKAVHVHGRTSCCLTVPPHSLSEFTGSHSMTDANACLAATGLICLGV